MPEQHPVEWTDEKVARIWDFYSGRLDDLYFAKSAGGYFLDVLGKHVPLEGARLLDYGCGQGFLFEHLERRGARVKYTGLDFSKGSVEQARSRFGGRPGFEGAVHAASVPTTLPDGSADIAVALEMIEHLDDERLGQAIGEMRRILRPGGILCLTTPNEEDMADQTMICPDCACVFHRWQHVRSWSASGLLDDMKTRGFENPRILTADFAPWYHRVKRAAMRQLRGGKPMNLMYLGVKSGR